MKTASELTELMFKDEPLCEELQPYVAKGRLGECIHHPYVIELFYRPDKCALVNERFRLKKEHINEAREKGDWHNYVALHERPYRFNAMQRVLAMAGPQHELIAWVWSDSENIFQSYGAWKLVLRNLPDRHKLMDEDELAVFNGLPDQVTIHRGWHKPGTWRGLSWTLDKEKALWFARRLADKAKPVVTSGTVKKSDVIAYFAGRGESEIVVFPEKVTLENKAAEIVTRSL